MEKNNNVKEVTPKEEIGQESLKTLEKKPAEQSKSILVWVVMFLLSGLIAGSFLYLQQQMKMIEKSALAQQLIATDITPLESEITKLKQTVMDGMAATEPRLAALDNANKALYEKIEEMAKTQALTNADVVESWNMAELEFLLQIANQSALLVRDLEKAQSALNLADQLLNSLTDPRLYQLRSLIADEKLALASVAKVDIEGLAIQLQSMLNKVEQLDVLMGPQLGQQDEGNSVAVSSSDWDTALSQAWLQIKSLVVIRHQKDAAVAVLVPEQRYFLYQNLSLKLETARLALLTGDESLFHDSLATSEQWLQRYFIGTERDAILELLKTLRSETIAVEVPDISASLLWLQQYGEQ